MEGHVSTGEYHDENTLFKAYSALVKINLNPDDAIRAIFAMQNAGILFREARPEQEKKDERPHSRACGMLIHPHGIQCKPDCPTCNKVG